MKKVRKAIFPVGGLGTRFLPATKAMPKEMLPVVDKPLIQYAVEEAKAAGIEEFIFVTGRGKSAIEDHFDISYELEHTLSERGKESLLQEAESCRMNPGQVFFTRQQEALGLGHAVWCARHFIHDEPVAVLLADDFIVSEKPCLSQMVEAYQETGGSMAAVMEVPTSQVKRYGIMDVKSEKGPLVDIKGMVEKPSPEEAPSNLAIIGRYILHGDIFSHLETQNPGAGGEIQLTDAMAQMIGTHPFHGYRFEGRRFDCGDKAGMVIATLNVALSRADMQGEIQEELATLNSDKRNFVA